MYRVLSEFKWVNPTIKGSTAPIQQYGEEFVDLTLINLARQIDDKLARYNRICWTMVLDPHAIGLRRGHHYDLK
jgi:hypothetical protein